MKVAAIESIRALLRNNSLDLYIKPKRATDWRTPLGLCQIQSVAGVYFPSWQGTGVFWYRDLRRVTRDLCRASWRYNPGDGSAVK